MRKVSVISHQRQFKYVIGHVIQKDGQLILYGLNGYARPNYEENATLKELASQIRRLDQGAKADKHFERHLSCWMQGIEVGKSIYIPEQDANNFISWLEFWQWERLV